MNKFTIISALLLPFLSVAKESTPPAPGFDRWIAEEFEDAPTPLALRSQDSDPDQDGLSNLMEYALDTDPLFSNGRPPTEVTMGPEGLTCTYSADNSKADIHYQIEVSEDLRTWRPVQSETLKAKGSIERRAATVPANKPAVFVRLAIRLTSLS